MKIKKLIAMLKEYPENSDVITYATNAHLRGEYWSSHEICDVELCKDGKMVGIIHGFS